jgi:hypothetical protein
MATNAINTLTQPFRMEKPIQMHKQVMPLEKTAKNKQSLQKGESTPEDTTKLIKTVKSLREKIQTLEKEKAKLLQEKSALTKAVGSS